MSGSFPKVRVKLPAVTPPEDTLPPNTPAPSTTEIEGADTMLPDEASTSPSGSRRGEGAPPRASSVAGPTAEAARYELAEEFARGGLGRIVRAFDRRLQRPVALKTLLALSGNAGERFLREALVSARLEHPAIVPIHDAGVLPSGEPYLAMKLVEGKHLGAVIKARATLPERLALLPQMISVCEAMAYAHSQGIIHRDLKPQNVLIGPFGEAVVIDWGLAKDIRAHEPEEPTSATPPSAPRPGLHDSDLTAVGAIVGTPAYMPPEQASSRALDPRADVYALGAILYQLFGGAPPYPGASSGEILKRLAQGPPRPIEELQPELAPDLVAIVKKAMSYEREARYPSAEALAEDLRRFQAGRLVGARQYSLRELVQRWARRNRAALGVALVLLGALVGLGVTSYVQIRAERDEAQRARADALDRQEEMILLHARQTLSRDPTEALAWLKTLTPQTTRWLQAQAIANEALARGVAARLFHFPEAIQQLAFSPDGARLAVLLRGGDIILYETRSWTSRVLRGSPGVPGGLRFAPNAAALFSLGPLSGKQRPLLRWDLVQERPPTRLGECPGELLAGSPDGRFLVCYPALTHSKVQTVLFDLNWSDRYELPRALAAVSFSADSRFLAGVFEDSVEQIDLQTLQGMRTQLAGVQSGDDGTFYSAPCGVVRFTPDGAWLWVGCQNGRLFRLPTQPPDAPPEHVATHNEPILDLDPANDGTTLAVTATRILLYGGERPAPPVVIAEVDAIPPELALPPGLRPGAAPLPALEELLSFGGSYPDARFVAGEQRLLLAGDHEAMQCAYQRSRGTAFFSCSSLLGQQGSVTSFGLAPGASWLATGAQDGSLRLWQPARGFGQVVVLEAPVIGALALSASGADLFAGGSDGSVRHLDLQDPAAPPRLLHTAGASLSRLLCDPQDQRLYALTTQGELSVWEEDEWRRGAPPRALEAPHPLSSIALSPDGRFLAAGSREGDLFLWDRAALSSPPRRFLQAAPGEIAYLLVSPDSQRLALVAFGAIVLFSPATGEVVSLPTKSDSWIDAAFSHDGRAFFYLSPAQGLVRRELATGTELRLPEGDRYTFALVASPYEPLLAVGGAEDGLLRVYEGEQGAPPLTLGGHQESIYSLRFLPNGGLLSAGMRGRVLFHDLRSKTRVELADQGAQISALEVARNGSWLAFSSVLLARRASGITLLRLLAAPDAESLFQELRARTTIELRGDQLVSP